MEWQADIDWLSWAWVAISLLVCVLVVRPRSLQGAWFNVFWFGLLIGLIAAYAWAGSWLLGLLFGD